MSLVNMTGVNIRDIAEDLEKIEIKKIEIPKFFIPNWPKDIVIESRLGKKNYRVPIQESSGLLGWKTGTCKISFKIRTNGAIRFDFYGLLGFNTVPAYNFLDPDHGRVRWVCSGSETNLSRLVALILFDGFKAEVLAKILVKLKSAVPIHNQIIDAVIRAFEPFVPFVVADELSKEGAQICHY